MNPEIWPAQPACPMCGAPTTGRHCHWCAEDERVRDEAADTARDGDVL